MEVGSPHIYASFGTFCAKIGQLFEAFKNQQIVVIEGILPNVQRLTVPRVIDQFGHKRW